MQLKPVQWDPNCSMRNNRQPDRQTDTAKLILYNKTNRRVKFQNLFWYVILHVSGNFSAHHQELSTVHSVLARVIQVWRQLACRIKFGIYCVCWFHCKEIYYDARSYEHKMTKQNVAFQTLPSRLKIIRYQYSTEVCLLLHIGSDVPVAAA
jgi:hypothetical protein